MSKGVSSANFRKKRHSRMGKRSLLITFLLATAILGITLGAAFVTAADIPYSGSGSVAEGCKKSYCGDLTE